MGMEVLKQEEQNNQEKVRTLAFPEHSEAFNPGTKSLGFTATEEAN